MTLDKSRWSLGPVGEGLFCAILRIVAVNSQKRVVDFVRIRSVLIKMHLSLISCKFLIYDMHRQLLWWNIAVGNFSSNEQKLLTIAPLLTSCWWHNKHISVNKKSAAKPPVKNQIKARGNGLSAVTVAHCPFKPHLTHENTCNKSWHRQTNSLWLTFHKQVIKHNVQSKAGQDGEEFYHTDTCAVKLTSQKMKAKAKQLLAQKRVHGIWSNMTEGWNWGHWRSSANEMEASEWKSPVSCFSEVFSDENLFECQKITQLRGQIQKHSVKNPTRFALLPSACDSRLCKNNQWRKQMQKSVERWPAQNC